MSFFLEEEATDELLGVITAAEADFLLPSFLGAAPPAEASSRGRFLDSEVFFGAKNEVIMT